MPAVSCDPLKMFEQITKQQKKQERSNTINEALSMLFIELISDGNKQPGRPGKACALPGTGTGNMCGTLEGQRERAEKNNRA